MPGPQHDREQTARAKLCLSGYAELKNVTCDYDVHGHQLILQGRVSSFYMKQRAQELVKFLEKENFVLNLIEVVDK